MPKPSKSETIRARFFTWRLRRRGSVYVADGRSNEIYVGRHSLGTRDRREAIERVHELDLAQAVERGLADPRELDGNGPVQVALEERRRMYEEHVRRPLIAGGPKPQSAKRYRPVLDKFLTFARARGITAWNQVDRRVLEQYAAYLVERDFAYATQYLELNTIKQIVKWLVESEHLPKDHRLAMPLRKPEGTDTHCWHPDEVQAIVAHCREQLGLQWLGDVVEFLASTGMRISEVANLRWSDIDLERNVIVLADETTSAKRGRKTNRRSTKSRRSRSFPIHPSLRELVERLEKSADGRVLHGPRGGVLKQDTVRRILVREVIEPLSRRFPTAEGEIGFADGRLHSFRHYFCSTCANGGVPERVAMQWLGHSSSRMVRHYYHLHDDESQRQMMQLNFTGKLGGCSTDDEPVSPPEDRDSANGNHPAD